MEVYSFAEIVASSTALLNIAVNTLVGSVTTFLPIVLYVAIPLGLLYAGVRWVRGRARVK